MKYLEELKRAMKFAGFLAAGVIFGAGIFPWVMEEDKAAATQRLIGTIWGVVGFFAVAVALMFVAEIIRTKKREKKNGK